MPGGVTTGKYTRYTIINFYNLIGSPHPAFLFREVVESPDELKPLHDIKARDVET